MSKFGVKFEHVVPKLCKRTETDRQTDRLRPTEIRGTLIAIFRTSPGGEVIN